MKRLLTLLVVFCCSQMFVAAEKPNVVLVMVDDLGYLDLGCYGHPSLKTPVLDKLAAGGVRFTDFHSGATVCTPSRMALMTGAYPTRLGWTQGVAGYLMGTHDGMSGKALTMAEIFKSEGYATGMSGKWHIGDQPDTDPNAQGFDSHYGLMMSNNQTKELLRDGKVIENPFENRLLTEQFTTEAIRFVRKNKDRPFFLYLAHTAPHFPVEPHPDWKGKSSFGKYGDVVEEIDFRLGQLFKELEKFGLTKKTIVVFCSDNGPNPGQQADCLPYRGEKWSALEGGTRVPCIISWPDHLPAGKTYPGLSSAMDLLPTLSDACGIDWRKKSTGVPKIDGMSLWQSIHGKAKHPRKELLLWHGKDADPQSIRVGDWKLFFDRRHALQGSGTKRRTKEQAEKIAVYEQGLKKDQPNPPFLFNVAKDPGETVDLSEKFPEKVTALQKRATTLMQQIKDDGILPLSGPKRK
ncbi:MAG: sulfatase-like hydrolase/transferase [Verrucomicrobiae bacterium]|nr:sulfatase-like hydrolase/transferase [Verrucomicrobiae bacterium]NNJ86368.1 sulfatase-like hydrolase/transferase [Akkermansiaceae bacterium]